MAEENICMVCGAAPTLVQKTYDDSSDVEKIFYSCPVCGRYEIVIPIGKKMEMDLNHLRSYLIYNGFHHEDKEYRYFTMMNKEWCDERKDKFSKGNITNEHPVHLSKENVENWYPKTFTEKVDSILLYLNSHIYHIGEELSLKKEELHGVLFVDRFDIENGQYKERTPRELEIQTVYMIRCLEESGYIKRREKWNGIEEEKPITLTPKGYARVDELLKYTSNGKRVLVAMSFNNTEALREAIRKGIEDAGYIADYIDEAQHNDFITPELLKHIRDSKFVVVDLTHQNNGAYFEEGYAMGLGKPVIQLCKKGVQLHFDIAQKNTIIWEVENDIPERLKNRIIATID